MKNVLIVLIAILTIPLVMGVAEDTNITLRAACVDSYGVLCDETARWTVLYPNGTTAYNNTLGGNTAYGICNFTIWLNLTGVWYAYSNFSSNNVSQEYNIVVEDYTTSTTTNIWGVVSMIGQIMLILGMVFFLVYMAIKLDKEHMIIKWFLALCSFWVLLIGVAAARQSNTLAGWSRLLDTTFYVLVVIISVVMAYAIVYLIYVVLVNLGKIVPKEGKNGENTKINKN